MIGPSEAPDDDIDELELLGDAIGEDGCSAIQYFAEAYGRGFSPSQEDLEAALGWDEARASAAMDVLLEFGVIELSDDQD